MLRKICLILMLGCVSVCGWGNSPNADLFRAIADEDYKGVVAAIERGADPNIRREKDGFTPLIASAQLDNVEIMKYLLSKGAHVNAQGKHGWSALYWVVGQDLVEKNPQYGKEMVRLLLRAKANLNLRDENDETVLMQAARDGQNQMVRLLGKAGFVNAQTKEGYTALIWASMFGHAQTVRILLSLGANPNILTDINCTALHFAVLNGHTAVVKELLRAGAYKSIHVVNTDGNTPLMIATRHNYKEIAALLRKAGATH